MTDHASCEVSFWILMAATTAALIFSVSCYRMLRTVLKHVLQFKPPQFVAGIEVVVPPDDRRK